MPSPAFKGQKNHWEAQGRTGLRYLGISKSLGSSRRQQIQVGIKTV